MGGPGVWVALAPFFASLSYPAFALKSCERVRVNENWKEKVMNVLVWKIKEIGKARVPVASSLWGGWEWESVLRVVGGGGGGGFVGIWGMEKSNALPVDGVFLIFQPFNLIFGLGWMELLLRVGWIYFNF